MKQSDELEQKSQVKKTNRNRNHQNRSQATKDEKTPGAGPVKIQCKFCGREHEKKKEKCPAQSKKCSSCGKLNHFAKCCNRKQEKSESKEAYHVFSVAEADVSQKTVTFTVTETGSQVTYVIDSGAPFNILLGRDYHEATGDLGNDNIVPEKIEIVAYGGKKWPTLGYTWMNVRLRNEKKFRMKSWVVGVRAKPLLGLKSCEAMGIMKIYLCDQQAETAVHVDAVSESTVLKKYEDVFNGSGKLEGSITSN